MGCMTLYGKVLLVVINLFFLLIGAALLVTGCILTFGNDIIRPYYQSAIDAISSCITSTGFSAVDLSTFDVTTITGPLGVALIGAGVVILVMSISGFLGVCCNVKPLLIFYCITVAMAMIGVILLYVIISETTMLEDDVKPRLKTLIWNEYQGLNGTNANSVAWNVMHYKVGCCGVDSYDDFTAATRWDKQISTFTLKTPLTCCKALPKSASTAALNCAVSPTDSDNYRNVGCYKAVYKLLIPDLAYLLVFLIGLSILEIVLILFSVCILLENRKNKVDNSTPHEAKKRKLY